MDIKQWSNGTVVEGKSALVVKKAEATTKTNKAYLKLTLRDKSGQIEAKLWDYNQDAHGFVKEGGVVEVYGSVDEYNGMAQFTVKEIHPSIEPMEKFARSTRFDVEEMWVDLVKIVDSFKEPLTKFVTEEMLMKQATIVEAFKKAPAAKAVHNAWFGGLLEHVHSLCTIAEPLIKHYQTRYCEELSRDKVLFGLIMHDAGKIIEYDYRNPSFSLTPTGLFTNHIVIGPSWVFETANKFPEKPSDFKTERAHLMHILAAHHGKVEWGSPIPPASLEAVLVHHLDNLDATMLHAWELVDGKEGPIAGFSERSFFEKAAYFQYPNKK